MKVQPDLSEIKEEVSPGTYRGIIKGATVGEWKTGTKYVNWELETFGEVDPKNNGRRVFHKTPVEGKGAFRLADFYKAATGQVLKGAFDTDQLLNRKVEFEVIEGTTKEGTPSGYMEVGKVRTYTDSMHA